MREYAYDFCFVGLKCLDLLAGNDEPKYLGGIEKVLVSLAKGLSETGYNVAFITYDQADTDSSSISGIDVFTTYDPDSTDNRVATIYGKTGSLLKAMYRANAKVYIQMGAGTETTLTAYFSKLISVLKAKSRFVFLIASNSDCDPELPLISHNKEKVIYRHGLTLTDLIIAQTEIQKEMMKRSYRKDSLVLQPPIENKAVTFDKTGNTQHVLWMGRIIKEKRLELLLDVAETCTDIVFDVVGAPNQEDDYYREVIRRAKDIPNVNIHGKIPESELPVIFGKADLFCSTSTMEGFPTTFLEAWSNGIPVVTTFDPDSIVEREGLGITVTSRDQLIEAIKSLLGSNEKYEEVSKRSKRFFDQNYSISAVVPKFIEILNVSNVFEGDIDRFQ